VGRTAKLRARTKVALLEIRLAGVEGKLQSSQINQLPGQTALFILAGRQGLFRRVSNLGGRYHHSLHKDGSFVLIAIWLWYHVGMTEAPRTQRIRDPVHGLIVFEANRPVDQLAWRLLDSPEFQRLRRVKQLGVSEFVFPSSLSDLADYTKQRVSWRN
jgi:hypothetical protein